MVVGACQNFQLFRKKPDFSKTIKFVHTFIWDFALLNYYFWLFFAKTLWPTIFNFYKFSYVIKGGKVTY